MRSVITAAHNVGVDSSEANEAQSASTRERSHSRDCQTNYSISNQGHSYRVVESSHSRDCQTNYSISNQGHSCRVVESSLFQLYNITLRRIYIHNMICEFFENIKICKHNKK